MEKIETRHQSGGEKNTEIFSPEIQKQTGNTSNLVSNVTKKNEMKNIFENEGVIEKELNGKRYIFSKNFMFQEDAINLVKKHNAKLLTIEELQEMHNKKQLDRKAYWSNNTNQRFLAMGYGFNYVNNILAKQYVIGNIQN